MALKLFEEEYTTFQLEDDDEMRLIREALKRLTPVQRKIFLVYVETGTYTQTAKEFKVSTPTVKTYINNIKDKITQYIFDNI